MKNVKRVFVLLLLAIIVLSLVACNNREKSFQFEYWNDCEALTTLTSYVTAVTDEKSAALKAELLKLLDKQHEAVKFVTARKNPAYHDLMARNLVEMETIIFVGLLLLRDAGVCEERAAAAERYILDGIHDFNQRYAQVVSGDEKLIANNRDIIDY